MNQTFFSTLFQEHSAVVVIAGILSSFATCIAAFLSYKSIKQVNQLSYRQGIIQRRTATINFVSDSSQHVGTLYRNADKQIKDVEIYRDASDEKFIEDFHLNEYGISPGTIHRILKSIKKRIPLNYTHGLPISVIEELNVLCIFKSYSLLSDTHRSIATLFNRIEEVAIAINAGILDIEMLDKMYGGMISSIYFDHSNWLTYIKRRLGFRFYDQFDILNSNLFERASDVYDIRKPFTLFLLLFKKRGIKLAWHFVSSSKRYPNYINRKRLIKILVDLDLFDLLEWTSQNLRSRQIFFKNKPYGSNASKKNVKGIAHLFIDSLITSKGEWPVGIIDRNKNFSIALDENDISKVNDWVKKSQDNWDYTIEAYRTKFLKKEYIGFIAVSHPNTVCEKEERWNQEMLSAIKNSLGENRNSIVEILDELSIPYMNKQGNIKIDFSKMALIRSFYVRSHYRQNNNPYPIGRKLLRSAISYCRDEIHAIPFLTVLADSEFTEKAISLYVAEGGSYIGVCRDNNIPSNHLMHVFIF